MKKDHLVTILLALIWGTIMVLATISPFAQSGGASNEFGDIGMWLGLVFILILFLLPLYFQIKGSKVAKIVLAIIIGIFIIGAIAIVISAAVTLSESISIPLVLIIVFGLLYIIFSIVWYISAVKK